jgi:hypothetical protein
MRVALARTSCGPGVYGVRVKLASEISKKMFPVACTLMRADELAILGRIMFSEPSLVVAAASTMGKEAPPLVESRMSTAAA